MFLDLEKLLVKWENLGGTFLSRGGKLILSVGQNLFEMSQRHFRILPVGEAKLNVEQECHVERYANSGSDRNISDDCLATAGRNGWRFFASLRMTRMNAPETFAGQMAYNSIA